MINVPYKFRAVIEVTVWAPYNYDGTTLEPLGAPDQVAERAALEIESAVDRMPLDADIIGDIEEVAQ